MSRRRGVIAESNLHMLVKDAVSDRGHGERQGSHDRRSSFADIHANFTVNKSDDGPAQKKLVVHKTPDVRASLIAAMENNFVFSPLNLEERARVADMMHRV